MYPCSDDFHRAVADGEAQKSLLIFDDCVFTNDDINVDSGIEFHDYFNLEEDLAIGQTPSNEVDFTLFNDDRLLNSYAFGEFLATIGVLTETDTYSQRGICTVTASGNTFVTDSRSPYIKMNGTALSSQPNQQLKSMLAYDGKLYCFGENEGYYKIYNARTGAEITGITINSFMQRKAHTHWTGMGMKYHDRTEDGLTIHELVIWHAGKIEKYQFVPLGKFIADRPKAPDKIEINMTCNDFMVKFDKDWTDDTPSISYPTTISDLFIALSNNVLGSNRYRLPNPFINGDKTISSEPAEFSTASKRDVLKWIAEAACANARIDRDGYLILDWLKATGQTFDASGYSDFDPYWYKTKKVTKLYNRNSQDATDKTVGTGNEAYVILDNPLLKGVS